jgi:hypothetical protein
VDIRNQGVAQNTAENRKKNKRPYNTAIFIIVPATKPMNDPVAERSAF